MAVTLCSAQTMGVRNTPLSGWQIQPATDPAQLPGDDDWATLPVNVDNPHNNSGYDWRNLSTSKSGTTWAKVKHGDVNRLWWRTTFDLDQSWQGKRVMVDFAQIQGDAIVFCNGKRVSELLRPGGVVELTACVQVGKTNTLSVFNTRDYTGISRNFEQDVLRYLSRHVNREIPMSQWGLGITGPVTLQPITIPVGITDVYARCSWDDKILNLDVQTDATQPIDRAVFAATIRDVDGKVALQFESNPLPIAQGSHTQTITSKWANPIGWQLESPYLYTVEVSLKQQGKTFDTTPDQSFGFRDIKVVGREIHINGIKTRLRTSSFISGKTEGDIAFLNMMGYNFFYIQPNPTSWWQNWSETRIYTENFLKYTDQHGLALSLPIPGIDHLRGKLIEDEAVKKAYVAEQQAFVRRYRGHPSVFFWTVGMNTMNPQDAIHPLTLGRREKYSHPMADVIQFASDTAKAVDPNTLVYSHADGNQGDLSTSNLYTNFAPLQEREDWPMYYAKDGDMPFCAVEFGQPITANFIKAKQVYLPEFMAITLGDKVYADESNDALASINDVVNSPWVTDKYIPLYQDTYWDFHSLYMDRTNRSWRTYDITTIGYYWDFSISFGDPPGYDPKREKVFGKYAKYIKAIPTEVPDWVNKNFYIHRRGQQPLMTYIAGSPTHTDKTHAYFAGDTITKQLAFVWDGPGPNKLAADWQVTDAAGKVITKGTEQVTLKTGDIQLHPITFTAPKVTDRSELTLNMSVTKDGKQLATDSFNVEIYPVFSGKKVAGKIVVFDPAAKSTAWIKTLGRDVTTWQSGQSLADVKLLVIGREALTDLKALPYTESDIRNGLNVLILQQLPVDWEKMGLKCLEVGTRILEPRLVNDPIVKGLSMTDLSYWHGDADLLPENKPARSYDVRRAARVNNKHVVAPVMFEIPQRVGFTSLMAGEFDMNYSPLLRYRDGKGQVMFCSLSFTDRVGRDPVPTQIAYALLNDAPNQPTRATQFVGSNKALTALNMASQIDAPTNGLLIVDGKDTHLSAQELRSYAAGGGNILVFQASDALTTSLGYRTQKLSLRKADQSDALKQMGIGLNMLRWREALNVTGFATEGQPDGATVLASGLMLQQKIDAGTILIAQFSPDMLDTDEPYHTQIASQHLRQLASQLMTMMGATPSTEQSKLLNSIQSGAKFNWLKYWHVLGPIKAEGKGADALNPEYPGHKAAITGDTNPNFFYQQADGSNLDFRKTVMARENGFVDIASVVNQADGYVAYATREVQSDTARAAILKIGVDYWADVYLNGKQVYRAINRKGAPRANNMSVKLNLNKGTNVITLKVLSGSRGFGFWASLSEGDINELQQQQQDQSAGVRLYTPLPQPFDPYEYHYW
jgi:beta-galactosidase